MTRHLTVAERLATAEKDVLLAEIADQSEWSLFVVQQAVLTFGSQHDEFSCNDLRDVLPELGQGFLGSAINGLRRGGVIEHTGNYVPSTSAKTHAHVIAVWRLSVRGLVIAEQRRQAAQGRAA
ncbi:hypothetical protein [Streptomyces sp. NPDC059994]|uniref:hypothetical protein n=1 Tax=Streptomyces sp. NPDC059994 TaxID=3347029 RepID=UPI003679FD45